MDSSLKYANGYWHTKTERSATTHASLQERKKNFETFFECWGKFSTTFSMWETLTNKLQMGLMSSLGGSVVHTTSHGKS